MAEYLALYEPYKETTYAPPPLLDGLPEYTSRKYDAEHDPAIPYREPENPYEKPHQPYQHTFPKYTKYYPEYTGGDNFEAACKFFNEKFREKNKEGKSIYSHATCATDTGNVRFVFDSVVSIILDQNMKDSGLG